MEEVVFLYAMLRFQVVHRPSNLPVLRTVRVVSKYIPPCTMHISVAISADRAAKYAITHLCEMERTHASIFRDQKCSVCL